MTPFDRFVRQTFTGQKFIAHCYSEEEIVGPGPSEEKERYKASPFRTSLFEALTPDEDALVLIGPEGDFSVEEVQQALSLGFQSVSLSASRLRTETAALVAVHLMNLTHII